VTQGTFFGGTKRKIRIKRIFLLVPLTGFDFNQVLKELKAYLDLGQLIGQLAV